MKPLLAVFLLAGLAVYLFVLMKNVRPLSGYQKQYYDKISEFFGDAYDMIGNTIAIKQATAEEYEWERLKKKTKETLPLWMRQINIWGTLSLYQRVTILTTQMRIDGGEYRRLYELQIGLHG